MTESTDVLIVGGAAVGSATAYFLKRNGFKGSVTIVEKDTSFQWCASGRSLACLRQQFSTPENIYLSRFGIELVKRIKDELGPDADVGYRERGYLMMATETGRAILEANIRLQHQHGAKTELLEPAEISRRFPWLSTEGLAAAGWGPWGEGWVDPNALMTLFRKQAQARGATVVEGEVVDVETRGDRVSAVRLASGKRIACGVLVNAAGWHSWKIARMAGFELPVRPRKRLIFVIDCREELPGCGLMIDPTGVFFRPEGKYFVAGVSPPEDQDPDTEDFEIEHEMFERDIWPALAQRVPAFETVKVVNSWSCHYDYNTLDQNAILGPHPRVKNFYIACGFSGHGLQQSPAVGNATAEHIIHGAWRSIDLKRFEYGRFAANAPLRELNVI